MRSFNDIGRIKVFFKDPNKKGFFKMVKEVLVLWYLKKEFPFYYFKYVYRKRITNYKDYLSTKELVEIGSRKELHKPEYKYILDNKLFFALFFEKTTINTPRLLSYNLGSRFFFNNNVENIGSNLDLKHFLIKVFNEGNIEELFFRPPSEYGGKACFKITKKNLSQNLSEKYETLTKGLFVHTEIIKQHEEINKIHNKSVNTIRLISLITPKNTIEIICAFIRFGVGNSVVDNASSGGFIVGINMDSGTLKKLGHYLPEYGGAEIEKHPDTGFVFNKFKIPFFKEACEEVIKAVKIIPDRFIGWDVAITKNGPIIIEANTQPHLPLSNIAYGGLLKNQHLKNLVKELKKSK